MTILIYLKTCDHCGLKYFGKTIRSKKQCINSYKGSGKRWKWHIKYHKTTISTKIIGIFINEETCKEFCLWYSDTYDIVKNEKYANLINENGLDGGIKGISLSEETKEKIRQANIGKLKSEETKEKIKQASIGKHKGENNGMYGKKHSEETKEKISNSMKGKTLTEEHKEKMRKPKQKMQCPYCNKIGGANAMRRYHFDNCKLKNIIND